MTETENVDVSQEIVNPSAGVDSQHAETQEQQAEPVQEAGQSQDKEYNFKALRESNARLQAQYEDERRRNELFKQSIEDKFAAQSSPQNEVDELADVADDDWTTRKHVETLARRQAKAIVDQTLAEDRNRRLKEELPDRLTSKHSDFESVVTKENVEYLKANKPHIATSLAAVQDPYAQALAAYDSIKAFCPSDAIRSDEARMQKNALKPGTLGAAQAPSPLTEAKALERGLSSEMRTKYQKEMIDAMRGY